MEKLVILGDGCAGSTAAIYAARAELKPVVYSGSQPGGQLTLTTEVENFPGFPDGITGPELTLKMRQQAERFGAVYKAGRATAVKKLEDGSIEVTIDDKEKIQTSALIVATGASARWLGLESEKEYKGKGVSVCATCDAFFYKGKPEVFVIGGGDSACEESLVLAKFADHVTIIHRKDALTASKIMAEKVLNHDKISFIWDSQVEEILGDGKKVTGVKLKNLKTEEVTEHSCNGIFLAIGHSPNTSFLKGIVELDEQGYMVTDKCMITNVPGIFAGGDVEDKVYRQGVTAAGCGCRAALEAEKYLND